MRPVQKLRFYLRNAQAGLLGLKLHGEKIPGSFYVIEQAQRPDAN
jgi:hypothetical protein